MAYRKRVIEAVFLSVLDYGDVVYRNASASVLRPLDIVYHSALRFVTGANYNTHHCALYDLVAWPSLSQRRDIHWFLFIFKTLSGKHPQYLSQLLSWNNNLYSTRSSDLLLLSVPKVRSLLGRSSFSFSAPHCWNLLQHSIKMDSVPSLPHFKSVIKQFCTTVCRCFT